MPVTVSRQQRLRKGLIARASSLRFDAQAIILKMDPFNHQRHLPLRTYRLTVLYPTVCVRA